MEVPTSNSASVSNAAGEVSNMIAPVRSMAGDTLILTWEFYDWIYGNFGASGQIVIVLDQVLDSYESKIKKEILTKEQFVTQVEEKLG